MQIEAGIMSGVEVSYQLYASAQAAASDVEQPVMRLEPLYHQEVELELANFFPEPANALAMPTSPHVRLQGSVIVVTADHHLLSPCSAISASQPFCPAPAREQNLVMMESRSLRPPSLPPRR